MRRFPFVWRKTAEDETAMWKAEADRQRQRAERAEATAATEVRARRRISEMYSDLFDELERVTGRNAVLCAQVETAKSTVFDDEKAQLAASRIARLAKAVARARAEAAAEKLRADKAETTLGNDDGKAIEAWERQAAAHEAWKAPFDRDKRPISGGTCRPTHPAIVLQRALARCRALEVRLSRAEGRRKPAAPTSGEASA